MMSSSNTITTMDVTSTSTSSDPNGTIDVDVTSTVIIVCFCYHSILTCTRVPHSDRRCQLVKRPRVDLESYEKIFLRLREPIKEGRRWTDKQVPTKPEIMKIDAEICGSPKFDVESSVFNGSDAPGRAWPWQVLIRGEIKLCGGVLISDSWVLTAAHCLNKTQSVVLGRNDLEHWTEYAVEKGAALEIPHAGYDNVNKESDIGLIKLSEPVTFNDHISPICLHRASPEDFIYPRTCYVTGWGMRTPTNKHLSKRLQQLKVNIMPHGFCRFLWSLKGFIIHSGHVCLQFNQTAPSSGVCSGDSGGPLNCLMNGKFFLFGLGSFVERGCMKNILPDVFTRLSDYIEWINKTITKHKTD